MEADNKVELGEILGPAGLMVGKDLGCGKLFQVLMIHDHVDQSTGDMVYKCACTDATILANYFCKF